MAGYTKEFLMNAFLSRYESLGEAKLEWMAQMASDFYDEVGKDEFRKYCSLDAAAIKLYKESLGTMV
jgi:hypothetical protein